MIGTTPDMTIITDKQPIKEKNMIAYKGTYGGKCRGVEFKEGETYTHNGCLHVCKCGFHFCSKKEDIYGYYDSDSHILKIMEIEVLGDVITEGDKSVTNKFKVLRFLNPEELPCWEKRDEKGREIYRFSFGREEWKEYDENNNLIHYKSANAHVREFWQEFDERNNLIHYKASNGTEFWQKFDERNNLTYSKSVDDDIEMWREYDERDNEIHVRNSKGYESWREYNENNQELHFKDTEGRELWKVYDKHANLVSFKDAKDPEEEVLRIFDEKNKEIYFKNGTEEEWKEYDERGCLVHQKRTSSHGVYERWQEFDERGHLIHSKDTRNYEYWQEYDERGNIISHRDSSGFGYWQEFNEKNNQIHYKNSGGLESWTEYDNLNNIVNYRSNYRSNKGKT